MLCSPMAEILVLDEILHPAVGKPNFAKSDLSRYEIFKQMLIGYCLMYFLVYFLFAVKVITMKCGLKCLYKIFMVITCKMVFIVKNTYLNCNDIIQAENRRDYLIPEARILFIHTI